MTLTVADTDGGMAILTDLAGREVLQVAPDPGRTEYCLDIGTLAPGTYLLRLVTPAGHGMRRNNSLACADAGFSARQISDIVQ